jgi:integrase
MRLPRISPQRRLDRGSVAPQARYIARLIKHFGSTPLDQIDQAAIDEAALALLPNVSPATRNVSVYTPTSAILHHAGLDVKLRRPKGAKGRIVTDWPSPEDASGIIQAADEFDREFGLLLRFLLYTGVRLGEALAVLWSDVSLEKRWVWIRRTKTDSPGIAELREDLTAKLAMHVLLRRRS